MKFKTSFSATLSLLAFTGTIQAAEPTTESPGPEFKVDTSLVYSAGKYGLDTTTTVWVGMINPSVETQSWRLQASVPYLRLDGPATVVGNVAGNSAVDRAESGIGDVSISLTHKIDRTGSGWLIELGGRIKFPTADEAKGLGTGKTDGSLQVDVFKVGSKVTPFTSVGYQFLGKDESYPMKSGPFASVGLVYPVSGKTTVGTIGNWKARMIAGEDAAVDAMVFVQQALTEHTSLQCFVMRGFTDATPTLCVGLTASLRF